MTQLLLPLPEIFRAAMPRAVNVARTMHSPNAARYHLALTAALNVHQLSPSVWAVMLSFAMQIGKRGWAEVNDTAADLSCSRNAVQQHLIGSSIFFDEVALPQDAPYHTRRRFTLSTDAISLMGKVKRETTRRYEHPATAP